MRARRPKRVKHSSHPEPSCSAIHSCRVGKLADSEWLGTAGSQRQRSYEILVSIPRLGALGRVIQAHAQDCFHVIVRELVIHMLAFSAARGRAHRLGADAAARTWSTFFRPAPQPVSVTQCSPVISSSRKAQAALVAGAAKESRCAFDDSGRAWLMFVRLVATRIIRM